MQRSIAVDSDSVDVRLGMEKEQEYVLVSAECRVVERRHPIVVPRLRVGNDSSTAAVYECYDGECYKKSDK